MGVLFATAGGPEVWGTDGSITGVIAADTGAGAGAADGDEDGADAGADAGTATTELEAGAASLPLGVGCC